MAMKDFRQGLEFIVKGVDRTKKAFEPGIDKVLAVAAANAAVVYEASNIIDNSDFSDPTNALIMMGTGGLLVAGNYLALLSPNTRTVRDLLTKANLSVDNFRPLSWVKTGALATALVIFGSELKPYTDQVMEDIFPKTRQELTESSGEKEYTAEPLSKVIPLSPQVNIQPSTQVSRNRPAYYNSLGYSPTVEHDFSGTRLADKNSMVGRVQRTLRWQPIYHTIEQKRRIPRDTLGGMIMQESYGNPVQPNASNDGGLGLTHIQGTTGPNYGLKIFGSSSKDSDKYHGRKIRDMLQECNDDPACVQKYDERGHLIKVLDTAARIVVEGKNKHGNWDAGVEYYRAPGKVGRNTTWRYLRDVKKWRLGLQDKTILERAARDFENRNGYSFNTYLQRWYQMSNNWGLQPYAKGN